MARYIDADAMKETVINAAKKSKVKDDSIAGVVKRLILLAIDEEPTVEAIPFTWLQTLADITKADVYNEIIEIWKADQAENGCEECKIERGE